MRAVILLLILYPCVVFAQADEEADLWKHFRPLVGEWHGTGEGASGTSVQDVQISFIFDEKYLRIKTKSVFPPQEKNPKGEVHEDVGYISFDKARKKFVLRQFHIEGFVNQYLLEKLPGDGKTFVFTSEALENAPPNWGAKVIYSLKGENEMGVSFHLSTGGEEFKCYVENLLHRKEEKPSMMKTITANLIVKDVNKSVGFYKDLLGFELVMSIPEEGPLDWAMMKQGGAEIMFQTAKNISKEYPLFEGKEIGGTLFLFIVMEGVENLYQKIKEKAKVTVDLHDTFYGMREFTIEDPDGYVLTFAEEISQ